MRFSERQISRSTLNLYRCRTMPETYLEEGAAGGELEVEMTVVADVMIVLVEAGVTEVLADEVAFPMALYDKDPLVLASCKRVNERKVE